MKRETEANGLSPDKSFTQRTLKYMLYTLCVCFGAVIVGRAVGLFDNEPLIILGLTLLLTGLGWWLSRGRHWNLAGYVPVAIVFAIGVYGSAGRDLGTYMLLFYGLAVLLAGALTTVWFSWIVLAASVAVHLSFAAPGLPLEAVLPVTITFAGCLAGILAIESLFSAELRNALHNAEAAAESLSAEIEVRRKAESDLVDRESDLRAILDQNSDGIAVTDDVGSIIEWNPAISNLTGLDSTRALGRPLTDVLGPITHQRDGAATRWTQTYSSISAHDEPTSPASCRDVQIIAEDGLKRVVDLLIFSVDRAGGRRVVLGMRDVTTQRQHEAERQKRTQLESLGVLAGGLAHDFNNLLTSIAGNLSLARVSTDTIESRSEALERADSACGHAHDLANRLLTFANGGAPILEAVCISDCIEEAMAAVDHVNDIEIQMSVPDPPPEVRADRLQIRQAIQNVLHNAVQATRAGGTVAVEVLDTRVGAESELQLSAGDYVTVRVFNRGTEIPPDIQPQVFDPYFTTKPGADGLGLTMAHSILDRHNGLVTFSSDSDGTMFTVYVPAATDQISTSKRMSRKPPTTRRILVLDDEESVRLVTEKMLQHLGYETESVTDGQEAFDAYSRARELGTPFDAVIMDLTIKHGIGGEETLAMIRERFPDVTAIVSSGYSSDPIMADHVAHGFKGVIVKPITLDKLRDVLARAFDSYHPGEQPDGSERA